MAKTPEGSKKLPDKNTTFEKSTGKSSFSPHLRSKKTDIAMWVDQGKNEDQILAMVGGGVSREEFKRFLQANNFQIKSMKPGKR